MKYVINIRGHFLVLLINYVVINRVGKLTAFCSNTKKFQQNKFK